MAGDWIKMRNDLRTDPTVFKLASMTGLDRFAIVGRLAEFWGWADKHAVDGYVDGATPQVIDDVVVYEGFAEKLAVVGWLELTADGIRIPKHERHNGDSAKERTLKSARQARWREKKASETAPNSVDVLPSTAPSTREEKRREEKKEAKASSPQGFAPPDWVPAEQWASFVQMRKAMRNVPFTDAAAKGVVAELQRLCDAGGDASELLQAAVTNGWRTVYPPKTNGHSGNKQEALEQRNRATGAAWLAKDRGFV